MDFLLFDIAWPILLFIGFCVLVVKFFSFPKGEKLDPTHWKKVGLGLSVALIFPLMISYGFTTFVDETERDYSYMQLKPSSERDIRINGNRDWSYFYYAPGPNRMTRGEVITQAQYKVLLTQHDEAQEKSTRDYWAAKEEYHTYLFVTMVVFGVGAIAAGIATTIAAASTGVLYGGLLSIMFGFIDYWPYLNDAAIFVALLLAFGSLLYVAYKKFGKTEE